MFWGVKEKHHHVVTGKLRNKISQRRNTIIFLKQQESPDFPTRQRVDKHLQGSLNWKERIWNPVFFLENAQWSSLTAVLNVLIRVMGVDNHNAADVTGSI
jgi:hypothetical protein